MKTRIKIGNQEGGNPIQPDQKFVILAQMIIKLPCIQSMKMSGSMGLCIFERSFPIKFFE